jgi:hypothetical protein
MSFNFSPKISSLDSLIYYLDASNTKSYISGSTTWYDISRTMINSTLVNGPTFNSANGGSIVFDGTNDYVIIPQITTNQTIGNYSFSVWLNLTTTRTSSSASNFMIMEAQNLLLGGVDNYLYLLSNSTVPGGNGRMGFQTFNPLSTVYTTTNTWVGNQWYNIVCTYDISTSKQSIYVNGVLEGSTTIANCYFNTNTFFGLGGYSDTVNPRQWFFNGKISNFMIYKKTLSSDEILKNYNATKTKFGL